MPSFLLSVRTLCLGSAAVLTHSWGFEDMGGLFLQHPCTQNMLEVPPFEQCSLSFPAQQNTLGLRASCAERKLREANFMASWWVSFQLLWQNTDQNQLIGEGHHCGMSEQELMAGIWIRNNEEAWPTGSPCGWLRGSGLTSFLTQCLLDHLPPWKLHWKWTGPFCVN